MKYKAIKVETKLQKVVVAVTVVVKKEMKMMIVNIVVVAKIIHPNLTLMIAKVAVQIVRIMMKMMMIRKKI